MVSIILIKPETAGNVGAIARAMSNFGFSELVLVEPQCDHLSKEAQDRAKHAKEILQKTKLMIWKDVRKTYSTLVATTGVLGSDYNLPRSPITPRQLAEIMPSHKKVGLVFGPEGPGLSNEQIKDCDFSVTIPTTDNYPSLNLSHAVTILLYELAYAHQAKKLDEHFPLATPRMHDVLLDVLETVITKTPFPKPGMPETQRRLWKRMFGKSFLTRREAQALIGFLRKVGERMK